ncbi:hypothetical protein JYU20_00670 [Bacteroidales bacterium AH-315-I05]|nr:hypothetical protein [Bacteroidales bacterium AH-315-I05]
MEKIVTRYKELEGKRLRTNARLVRDNSKNLLEIIELEINGKPPTEMERFFLENSGEPKPLEFTVGVLTAASKDFQQFHYRFQGKSEGFILSKYVVDQLLENGKAVFPINAFEEKWFEIIEK